jgi:hypothetical protein
VPAVGLVDEPPPSLGRELETQRAPSRSDLPRVELPSQPKAVGVEVVAEAPAQVAAAVAAPPAPAVEAPAPAPAGAPRRRSPLLWIGSVVLVLAAAATAAFVLELGPFARPKPSTNAPVLAPPARATVAPPSPTVTAPVAVASAPPSASVAPSGSAQPAVEPPASGSAAVPASALPPVDSAGAGDGSELNWDEGYLVVRSAAAVEVYASGFKVGATNRKNKSKCGLRFVRLGEKEPPRWRSKGRTVDVKCKAVTELEIAPD